MGDYFSFFFFSFPTIVRHKLISGVSEVLCVVPCLLRGGNKSSKNLHGGRHPPCEQEPYPHGPAPLPARPEPSLPPAPARLQRGRPGRPPPRASPILCRASPALGAAGARQSPGEPEQRHSPDTPTSLPGPQLRAGVSRRADDLRRWRLQPRTVKTRGRKDTLDGTHGDRTAGK